MNSLYEQLNDLFKIHLAARELEHGIRDDRWRLFEPSKFVYAFFAFNSFYSINWEDTEKHQKLVKWDIGSEPNNIDEPIKTESQKIRELRKYIYYSYVRNDKDKIEQKKGKEEIAALFICKLKDYLDDSIDSAKESVLSIVTDNVINMDKKNRFIRDFKNLADTKLTGKEFNDALDNVLYFIFLVRNNIFHGSKTVVDMMEQEQKKRFEIYTAILLTINELLFNSIEKNLNWSRKEIEDNMERKNKLKENRIVNRFLMNTVSSKFKIEVPEGIFFYPCCGNDTYEPLRLFIDKILEFHFVDNELLPKLPNLELGIDDVKDQTYNERSVRATQTIPKEIITKAKETTAENEVSIEILEKLDKLYLKPTGFRNEITRTYEQEWTYTLRKDRNIKVYRHIQDGLITFMGLDNIAVFFLRGDSEGEGGSGQRWFQPEIFDLILDKLVNGGILVTDGSSNDPKTYLTVPWRPLWQNKDYRRNDNPKRPDDFYYKGRFFKCIEKCGHRYGPVYIWKVTNQIN